MSAMSKAMQMKRAPVRSGKSLYHLTLQGKCACGAPSSLSGSCAKCQRKKLLGQVLQSKLWINEPGDQYEREADRVAEQAMSPRDSERRAGQWIARCASLTVQRAAGFSQAPSSVQQVLSSAGRALDDRTRGFFEARLDHDFSSVRIHADSLAARSAADLNAHAYTVGHHLVFGAGEYQPATRAGRRLLAHELTHVVQQGGVIATGVVQRSPVFPDDSCDSGRIQEKLTGYVASALELVRQTVDRLSDPEQVAGPLRRFFHFDPTIPGQLTAAPRVLPTLRKNLGKLQTELAAPTPSRCETGASVRGSRGHALFDPDTHLVIHEAGIVYNRRTLKLITLPRQIVNTIIHEYAHLANIGHHEPPGEPISNEDSTKVRGLTTLEALNNAESYMRFVRAVTSEPIISLKRREPITENGAKSSGKKLQSASTESEVTDDPSCGGLDQLVPPRFLQDEREERSTLETYYPALRGHCFRILRGGDDSCFGYCLHRAGGGDPLSKGVNLAIPPTIDEFERAFAEYYAPIPLEAVDAANPPADAVLALFARGDTPAHVACRSDFQYQGQYLWESKVSPVFPLILHHLSDLEGGAAGDVVRLYRRRSVEQP
jgi:hypothetical protein